MVQNPGYFGIEREEPVGLVADLVALPAEGWGGAIDPSAPTVPEGEIEVEDDEGREAHV